MGIADDVRARALAWLARSTAPQVPTPSVTQAQGGDRDTEAADLAVVTVAALCRRFEGFYAAPYLCPAGVPTIGFGATYYEDGRRVTLRDPPINRQRVLKRYCCGTSAPCTCQQCSACAPA